MTESEWLGSADPAAMLHCLEVQSVRGHIDGIIGKVSDRKLRLFACACRRLTSLPWDGASSGWQYMEDHPEESVRNSDNPLAEVPALDHASLFLSDTALGHKLDAAQLATLLRDIVGSPFRQATVPHESWRDPRNKVIADWKLDERPVVWPSQITPTVLALAQQAYDERGRECKRCCGWSAKAPEPDRKHMCGECRGTGRIDDGTLNPQRLMVLSDALEEAGCTDQLIMRHLRGWEPCPNHTIADPRACDLCNDNGWIPLRGPHVRGCWSVDLILGKE